MPKVGMPEIRRPQLIKATIKVIGKVGLSNASVSLIGRTAGVSPGIINHYFGGKEGLLEATMRYILKELSDKIQTSLKDIRDDDPLARINIIVKANFVGLQGEHDSVATWLAFWSRSMHDPSLYRLQQVNEKRLLSYLRIELRKMFPRYEAQFIAKALASLIDGIWIRGALAPGGIDPDLAEKIINDYIATRVPEKFLELNKKNYN